MNKIDHKNSDRAQSLYKGLIILQSFGEGSSEMTLTEVANLVNMNKATTRRFLLTLADLGYLIQRGKKFSLTPKVMTLGYHYLNHQPWWQLANPVVKEVSDRLAESCSIGALSGNQLIFVARAQGPRALTINLTPGRVVPVNTAAIGRVLLAEKSDSEIDDFFVKTKLEKMTEYTITDKEKLKSILRDVKRDGYSIVNQELELGLLAAAVPIRDIQGNAVAAIGISTQAQRTTQDEIRNNMLLVLREAAFKISHLMGSSSLG